MKKYIILGLLSALPAASFASCFYQEIDPVCSITGVTYTSSCEGWSDTSSWSIPIAYEGACKETPALTKNEQTKIYSLLDGLFTQTGYYGSLYGDDVDLESQGLNTTGQTFTKDLLFPAIKSFIAQEVSKTQPNMKKVAVFNYLASLIGYDYYVSMPDQE